MIEISIVIPVYNAEACLYELCRRINKSLSSLTANFEIIFIEDGGKDKSWEIITELAKSDKRIKGIQLSRNFGQHYAITAGLDHCDGNWAVVMDCDLQDQPEEISRLYSKAKEGYDVVLAVRKKRKDNFIKCFASFIFYKFFSYLSDINYDWRVGNFRIISRKVVQNFLQVRERLRFFGGVVDWMGFSTANIEVEHAPRFKGKSTYSLKKLLTLAMDTIIAYSDKPLKLTVYLGFLMAVSSFFIGCNFLFRALRHSSSVAGWNSLIISLYFIGGVIIFILGIIGIYLGKTFDETKKRPLYIIKNFTFDEKK